RVVVANHALRPARILPRLTADLFRLAVHEERGFGLGVVPLVGVAGPGAVRVAHEEARLDALSSDAELFHRDRAYGEVPVAVSADLDLPALRKRDPASFVGAI